MEQTFQDLMDQGEARKAERVSNREILVENRPEDNTFKWHDE
jgi:hypothetical protein